MFERIDANVGDWRKALIKLDKIAARTLRAGGEVTKDLRPGQKVEYAAENLQTSKDRANYLIDKTWTPILNKIRLAKGKAINPMDTGQGFDGGAYDVVIGVLDGETDT